MTRSPERQVGSSRKRKARKQKAALKRNQESEWTGLDGAARLRLDMTNADDAATMSASAVAAAMKRKRGPTLTERGVLDEAVLKRYGFYAQEEEEGVAGRVRSPASHSTGQPDNRTPGNKLEL
jgi:hypothetical protein